MRRALALLLLLLLPSLLAGCETARRSQTVEGMQVLALRAEPPTARPGETVRLEALVVTPEENDPDVAVTWFVCTKEFDECAKAEVPGEDVVVLGNARAVEVTIPENAFSGDTFLVWMDARKGGRRERSIKGVYVRPATEPPNRNPRLDRVRWGGEVPLASTTKGSRVDVRVGSSEMINEIWLDSGEPASEDVQIGTWTTKGALVDPSGTGASGELWFDAPSKKGRVGTWIIVNDDRGGVSWVEHWITVEGNEE